MFGEKPKKTRTPLAAGHHPENHLSDFCNQDQIVGQPIWLSGLGRFDIAGHVMTSNKIELDTLKG